MRKEFDLQCRSPDLTISGDEKLLFVCMCVVGQHVILGFWGLIKELCKKCDSQICSEVKLFP